MKDFLTQAFYKLVKNNKISLPKENGKLFEAFLDYILDTIEISNAAKHKLIFDDCVKQLEDFIPQIIDSHKEAAADPENGHLYQKAFEDFEPTDPRTWFLFQSPDVYHFGAENESYRLKTNKKYFHEIFPQEILSFLPEYIELSVQYQVSMYTGTVDDVRIQLGYPSAADHDKPVFVCDFPFISIFQNLTSEKLNPKTVKAFIDHFSKDIFADPFRLELSLARSCLNFLQEPFSKHPKAVFPTSENHVLVLDDTGQAIDLFQSQSPISGNEAFETWNVDPPYTLTNALLTVFPNTQEREILAAFSEIDLYPLIYESVFRYVECFPQYSEQYYKEISKKFPVPRRVHDFLVTSFAEAFSNFLKYQKEELPLEFAELYPSIVGEEASSELDVLKDLPSAEAFLQEEDVNLIFRKAFVGTLTFGFLRTLDVLFDRTIHDALLEGDLSVLSFNLGTNTYISRVLKTYLSWYHVDELRMQNTPDVIAAALFGIDFKVISKEMSLHYKDVETAFDKRSSSFFSLPPTGPEALFLNQPSGETIFRMKLRGYIGDMLEAAGITRPVDPNDEDAELANKEQQSRLLERALDNLAMEDVYLYRSGEGSYASTYLSQFLALVAYDIFAMTPFRTIPSILAKNFSNHVFYETLVKPTFFQKNAEYYDFLFDATTKSKKAVIKNLPSGSKGIFGMTYVTLKNAISNLLAPLYFTNAAFAYCDLLLATTELTGDEDSRDVKILETYLELNAEDPLEGYLDLEELGNYLSKDIHKSIKGITTALSFFDLFSKYCQENFDAETTQYTAFKQAIISDSDYENAFEALRTFCSDVSHVNSKKAFGNKMAPIIDAISQALQCLIDYSNLALVRKLPTSVKQTLDMEKQYFFYDEPFHFDISEITKAFLICFEGLFTYRYLDKAESSPTVILSLLDKTHSTIIEPLNDKLLALLEKLEKWPFDDKKMLNERLGVLYSIVFLHELVSKTQFAILVKLGF